MAWRGDSAGHRRAALKAHRARSGGIARSRYTGKAGLPHVRSQWTPSFFGWSSNTSYPDSFSAQVVKKGKVVGALSGEVYKRTLWIQSVEKRSNIDKFGWTSNAYHLSHPAAPTLEPGASLLTAASRAALGKKLSMRVHMSTADPFYTLTGGKKQGWDFTYSKKAMQKLAGRRIVMVRPKSQSPKNSKLSDTALDKKIRRIQNRRRTRRK